MGKAFVVLNPVAGNADAETVRRALARHLEGQRWSYEVYETTGLERLSIIVRSAIERGFDLVVAAGGDGTVSETVEGLVNGETPLAILPIGTGNALARDLGIPLNLEEALHLLTGPGNVRAIDAMRIGDGYAILSLGIGLSAQALRKTGPRQKRRLGRLAYAWSGLTEFLGWQRRQFTLLADGERHQMRASEVIVLNSGGLGAPYVDWGDRVCPDDGQVDVRVIRARTLWDYAGLAWSLLSGQEQTTRSLKQLRVKRSLTVRTPRPLPVEADGDLIGQTPVQIEVVPEAVKVIVPYH
jgi:YegS/Rv2252/BmrU family lipid kinase